MNRASFLVPDRHFALLLDLMMYLTSPAVAKQMMNWYRNLTTIRGQQEVRSFPFGMKGSSHVWSSVAFDRWPTYRYTRVLRIPLHVIELQASPRVTALLRRDQDRKRILVLPRLFALHRWLLPLLWDLAKNAWKLKNTEKATFLYSPIEARAMLAPTSKSPEEREFVVDSGASMCMLSKKVLISEELETLRISRTSMLLCGRIFLVARFRLVFFPKIKKRARGLRSCGSHF